MDDQFYHFLVRVTTGESVLTSPVPLTIMEAANAIKEKLIKAGQPYVEVTGLPTKIFNKFFAQ